MKKYNQIDQSNQMQKKYIQTFFNTQNINNIMLRNDSCR